MRLDWKDSFCCENQLIDSQHQSLFDISNELLDAILSDHPSTDISAIITRLLDDVSQLMAKFIGKRQFNPIFSA